MAKSKVNVPAISNAVKESKSKNFLPIFYFFGEDSFSIDNALRTVEESFKDIITSDFDKEYFYGDEKNLNEVLDLAAAFPFGSEKKLIIFKDFEKVKDKKALTAYAKSPVDFTTIIFIHRGAITNLSSDPFKTLAAKNFIFEAKELKGHNLINWIIEYAEAKGKHLPAENAQLLVDIVGESRSLIEDQLEKILIFLGDEKEITLQSIQALSTALKQYTIFDLQNALAKKDKKNSLKIAFNLLEKGAEPTYIIHMLTRYFTGLSRIKELNQLKMSDQEAARIVGTHPYYYKDHKKAREKYSDRELFNAVKSLLKADFSVKSTSTDNKSIIVQLIGEILQAASN
jgi:DNA polymerase III subunit delta